MKLAPVADIRDAMGFDDMTNINMAIEAALHAADVVLQSMLGTSFERREIVDTFFIEKPGLFTPFVQSTEFRLSAGFITEISRLVLGERIDAFEPGGGAIDCTGVFKSYNQDLDRGILKDNSTRYDRQFVQVAYMAGFEADAEDEDSYNLDQVPKWLQEIAKLQAKIELADDDTLKEANYTIDVKTASMQVRNALSRKLRYAPCSILPL